jgi:hypothetical protein
LRHQIDGIHTDACADCFFKAARKRLITFVLPRTTGVWRIKYRSRRDTGLSSTLLQANDKPFIKPVSDQDFILTWDIVSMLSRQFNCRDHPIKLFVSERYRLQTRNSWRDKSKNKPTAAEYGGKTASAPTIE